MASSRSWSAKKPRLDVAPTNKVVDDLWGEDLSLDAVEECVFQASQFYPELKRTEIVCSQTLPGSSQYFAAFQPAHNSTTIPSTSEYRDDHISKECTEKLEAEIKKLKDELQGKAGEILYLRNQKKVDESIWNNQLAAKTKLHIDRIRTLEKESSLAQTTIELMRVDLWKATENAPIARPPLAVSAVSEERMVLRVEHADGELLEDVLSPHLFERSEPEDFDRKSCGSNNLMEACWRPVQRLCLEESFASRRALPHIHAVFKACGDVVSALVSALQDGGIAETLEDLQRRDRELVECLEPTPAPERLRPLSGRRWFNGESGVDTRRALAALVAVCTLSQRAAEITLSVHGHPRSRQTASSESQKSGLSEYVTCASKLSPEGVGPSVQNGTVDMERAGPSHQNNDLGISRKSSSFTSRQNGIKRAGSLQNEQMDVEKEGLFLVNGRNDTEKADPDPCCLNGSMETRWEEPGGEPMGLLPLLCDLARVVSSRRHALAYGGVLTEICALIGSAVRDINIPQQSIALIGETLRWVVLARPRIFALPALLSTLCALSWSATLAATMCRPETTRGCVLREDGVAVLAHDACFIEMLCWLAEQRDSSVDNRARLYKALFDWVWCSVKQRPRGPVWSRAKEPTALPDECQCRSRLAELCVRSAHRTLIDFEANFDGCLGEALRKTLVRGMMLLHYLTDTDPDFGRHMLHAEGNYQLLLIGLRETTHDLRLDMYEDEALRELLAMEEAVTSSEQVAHFKVTAGATQDLGRLSTSLQRCWAGDTWTSVVK